MANGSSKDGARARFVDAPLSLPTRDNPGDWIPFVDWWEVFPGNRGRARDGRYGLFDAPVGVALRIEEASSAPILVADRPWEAASSLQPQHAWLADDRYHLLYRAGSMMCYAHSGDGTEWEKPSLGQVEHEGSTDNNMIAVLTPNPGYLYDPTAPPDSRFRAMIQEGGWFDEQSGEPLSTEEGHRRLKRQDLEGEAYTGPRGRASHWVAGFASADGIVWRKVKEKIADFSADGGVAPGYDPASGRYFSYLRPGDVGRRSIGFTATDDFDHWPDEPRLVLFPDPQDDADVSFYGAGYFRYPSEYPLHCLLLQIYHQNTDTIDNQLAVSRDGIHWDRPERRPIVTLGAPGAGDDGMTRTWVSGLLALPDGSWGNPYEATSGLHNVQEGMWPPLTPPPLPSQVRMAQWRPHRLCGLEAREEGRFTIQTVQPVHGELNLNVRCRRGGWIRAELIHGIPSRLNPDCDPIPGFSFADCAPITGDHESVTVSWDGKTDVRSAGGSLGIRLQLFQAKVFAYRV